MMADDQVTQMEGVEMAQGEDSDDQPLFSEDEKRVLELYDRLEELQLEMALLKAQGVISQEVQHEASEDDIKQAQTELLETKVKHALRANVIQSVMVANPILNAIHPGPNDTIAEQDLLPMLEERDALALSLTALTSKLQDAQKQLTQVEGENIIIARENAELAATMMALAKETSTQKTEDVDDPKTRQELQELEEQVRLSRQKWRIIKETTSAIVVGSGIDWARDPELLELVLDDGDSD